MRNRTRIGDGPFSIIQASNYNPFRYRGLTKGECEMAYKKIYEYSTKTSLSSRFGLVAAELKTTTENLQKYMKFHGIDKELKETAKKPKVVKKVPKPKKVSKIKFIDEPVLYTKGGLIECAELCKAKKVDCPCDKCQYWINYAPDLNCSLVAAQVRGPLSFRDIAKRLGLSFVMIQQIEKKALKKARQMIAKSEMQGEGTF